MKYTKEQLKDLVLISRDNVCSTRPCNECSWRLTDKTCILLELVQTNGRDLDLPPSKSIQLLAKELIREML